MYPDATKRFGMRADDYARYRPSYPREIVSAVLENFTAPRIADLGAGTGISARLLADAGAHVVAVEPNDAMRAQIVPDERIEVVAGTAEATALPPASVDIVTAFQAYHWFDVPDVMREALRITRLPARFAAVWNHRDLDDPFSAAYETTIAPYDASHGALDRHRRSGTVLDDLKAAGWSRTRAVTVKHRHPLDWDALHGFSRSASYLPREGAAADALHRDLRQFYESWSRKGPVGFIWVTTAYLGERERP
jgi:SAM-dependent methyltransferase